MHQESKKQINGSQKVLQSYQNIKLLPSLPSSPSSRLNQSMQMPHSKKIDQIKISYQVDQLYFQKIHKESQSCKASPQKQFYNEQKSQSYDSFSDFDNFSVYIGNNNQENQIQEEQTKKFFFDKDEYIMSIYGVNNEYIMVLLGIKTSKNREYKIYTKEEELELKQLFNQQFNLESPKNFHISNIKIQKYSCLSEFEQGQVINVKFSPQITNNSNKIGNGQELSKKLKKVTPLDLVKFTYKYLEVKELATLLRVSKLFNSLKHNLQFLVILMQKILESCSVTHRLFYSQILENAQKKLFFSQTLKDLDAILNFTKDRLKIPKNINSVESFGSWSLNEYQNFQLLEKKFTVQGNQYTPSILKFEIDTNTHINKQEWETFQQDKLYLVFGSYIQKTNTTLKCQIRIQFFSQEIQKQVNIKHLRENKFRLVKLRVRARDLVQNGQKKDKDIPFMASFIIEVQSSNQNCDLPMLSLVNPFVCLIPIDEYKSSQVKFKF